MSAAVNDQRKRAMARKVVANGSIRGKTIAVLGLSFKPNTDDMRDSPSIPLITALPISGLPCAATIRPPWSRRLVVGRSILTSFNRREIIGRYRVVWINNVGRIVFQRLEPSDHLFPVERPATNSLSHCVVDTIRNCIVQATR